ncbi:hypothetical protein SLEP1_g2822 [Rubroshorea leprosula]|uniref:Uncharacterized protein n=1 Tax=Rubroshorea leprosula TaxID=152421 RepID=A0AAV5HPX5_9ROSI|nr:hypothetical protein SLEP1_g2822 [Rubroshorea leprosula]
MCEQAFMVVPCQVMGWRNSSCSQYFCGHGDSALARECSRVTIVETGNGGGNAFHALAFLHTGGFLELQAALMALTQVQQGADTAVPQVVQERC